MPDYTRKTVNLNPETLATLTRIAGRRGITETETIRRALAAYELIDDAAAQGHTIQIKDGKTVREVVLL